MTLLEETGSLQNLLGLFAFPADDLTKSLAGLELGHQAAALDRLLIFGVGAHFRKLAFQILPCFSRNALGRGEAAILAGLDGIALFNERGHVGAQLIAFLAADGEPRVFSMRRKLEPEPK